MSISPCRLAEAGLVIEGAVRMAPLLGLPRLLADHGVEADTFIREAGCDPTLFRHPENTIDFAAVGRLLAKTAEVTEHPYPGLELGRRLGLGVFGVLGEALRLAPDLGTALRTLMLHFHLHDRGAVPSLWETHGHAIFGYTLYCPDVPGTDHIYDTALLVARNLISELVDRKWRCTEVQMFREPPADMEPFRRSFRAPLRFCADHAAIVFPTSDLSRPLLRANPNAYAKALHDLEEMEDASDVSLLGTNVLQLLHSMLISGSAKDNIDLRGIAQIFAPSPYLQSPPERRRDDLSCTAGRGPIQNCSAVAAGHQVANHGNRLSPRLCRFRIFRPRFSALVRNQCHKVAHIKKV